ncbi:MAG: SPOR domain-containing protein [Acidobacteria bacterium]|nr:SPOR domain-containing protein [Acidobacteriota bacterium]
MAAAPEAVHGYAVMAGSFPVDEASQPGSATSARLDSVIGTLQGMGYNVRLMDVNLKGRGDWRRVLAGEYATLEDARNEAQRLHRIPAFSDAQAIRC